MNPITKALRTKINLKVMAVFIIVLSCVLICTTAVTNYYSTKFIKEQRVKYNSQIMSKVIYDLNSLNSQITQFLNNYGSQNLYTEFYNNKVDVFNFDFLKNQIDFETDTKNKIYINNLQAVIKDIVFYFDESHYFHVGESGLDSNFIKSKSAWDKKYDESQKFYIVYGPMAKSYKTVKTADENEILYISKLITPTSLRTKKNSKPFIMVSVKFSEIQNIFEQLFSDNRGIVVSDSKGNLVYTNNVSEENIKNLNKRDHFKELKDNKLDYVTYSENNMFITSMYAEKYDWVISTVDSTEELFKDVNQLVRNINYLVAVCGVLGIIISLVFVKRLMMPIQVLHRLINTIEEETDTYIAITTDDEIGQIGLRFNHMKKRLQELNAKMYLSEVREKEAQISALQAQINPHFLYNTLDNIYCIAQIEEITPIVKLTQSLSSIMRYSIDCKDMYTNITEELKHVKAYIDIINVRYEDSIHYVVKMEKGAECAKTVKLFLQPIVENAWVHGILPKPKHQGTIIVDIHRKEDDLEIIVEDDGIGIEADALQSINESMRSFSKEIRAPKNKGFGIALINVNDRIKLMNGDEYAIRIESTKGSGSRVIIHQKFIEYK